MTDETVFSHKKIAGIYKKEPFFIIKKKLFGLEIAKFL
jgi:hypothetical protein